jgi:hypothetical protein
VAVAAVSTIAWAANVRSPRYTAAVGWLLLAAVANITSEWQVPDPVSHATADRLIGALAGILYPPWLVGTSVDGPGAVPAGALLVMGAASMAWALTSIHRSDIPLEASQ